MDFILSIGTFVLGFLTGYACLLKRLLSLSTKYEKSLILIEVFEAREAYIKKFMGEIKGFLKEQEVNNER